MGEPGAEGASSSATSSSGVNVEDLDPALVATMTADELKKFIETGRTGRRNALTDVSQPEAASSSTAGMAEALESLSVQAEPSSSQEKEQSGSGS